MLSTIEKEPEKLLSRQFIFFSLEIFGKEVFLTFGNPPEPGSLCEVYLLVEALEHLYRSSRLPECKQL